MVDFWRGSLEVLVSKFLTLISLQLWWQKNYCNFTMARTETSKLNILNIVAEYPRYTMNAMRLDNTECNCSAFLRLLSSDLVSG